MKLLLVLLVVSAGIVGLALSEWRLYSVIVALIGVFWSYQLSNDGTTAQGPARARKEMMRDPDLGVVLALALIALAVGYVYGVFSRLAGESTTYTLTMVLDAYFDLIGYLKRLA